VAGKIVIHAYDALLPDSEVAELRKEMELESVADDGDQNFIRILPLDCHMLFLGAN
jgi:hypothetical protein